MLFQLIQENVEDLKSTLPEDSDDFKTSGIDWVDSAYVHSLDEDAEIERKVAIAYDRLINEIEAESKGLLQPDKRVTVADIVQSARPTHRTAAHLHREAVAKLLARESAMRSKQQDPEEDTSQGSSLGRFGGSVRNTTRKGRTSRRSLAGTATASSRRRPSVRGEEEEDDDDEEEEEGKEKEKKPLQLQKHQKTRQLNWPSAESGFFCLLRGFLTQQNAGERRRLTTAQLCEYVREWQAQNARQLLRTTTTAAGGNLFSWISRSDDWSAVTPHVLQFLTGESIPLPSPGIGRSGDNSGSSSGSRHSSRRLTCPRPFVNYRPRVHQWSWLLTSNSSGGDTRERFAVETGDLERLFNEWVRAPRGLGGLADAEWLVAHSEQQHHRKPRQGRKADKESYSNEGSNKDHLTDGDDDEDDDGVMSRPLKIVDESCSFRDEKKDVPCEAAAGRGGGRKKTGRRSGKQATTGAAQARTGFPVDTSVPPPLFPTTCRVRAFTEEEKHLFQLQEHERFTRPWAPFVYRLPEHVAVVGPLRAAPGAKDPRRGDVASLTSSSSSATGTGYRARDHPMLRSDRPLLASLAEIVRDAVACLPNGEGSRADITTLVKHSGFLLPHANDRQLQQCVSSALDRLQGEAPDPSVYFNASRRLWVYRHRHRTPEEFAELHERRRAVLEAKKQVQRGHSQVTTSTASKRRLSAARGDGGPRARQNKYSLAGYSADPDLAGSATSSLSREETAADQDEIDDDERGEVDMGDDAYIPDIEELEAADLLRASTSGVVPVDSDDDEEDLDVYEGDGSAQRHVLTCYHRASSHLRAAQGFHDLGDASDSFEDDLDDVELLPMASVPTGRSLSARFYRHGQTIVGRSNPVGRRREPRGSLPLDLVGDQLTGYPVDDGGYQTQGLRSQLRFVDNDDLDISSFVGFPHPHSALEPRQFGNYPYSLGEHHF